MDPNGELAKMEKLYRESLAMSYNIHGKPSPHPNIAVSLHRLGRLLQSQGKLVEAERRYRESLSMSYNILGKNGSPAVPSTARVLNYYCVSGSYDDLLEDNLSTFSIHFVLVIDPGCHSKEAFKRELCANPFLSGLNSDFEEVRDIIIRRLAGTRDDSRSRDISKVENMELSEYLEFCRQPLFSYINLYADKNGVSVNTERNKWRVKEPDSHNKRRIAELENYEGFILLPDDFLFIYDTKTAFCS